MQERGEPDCAAADAWPSSNTTARGSTVLTLARSQMESFGCPWVLVLDYAAERVPTHAAVPRLPPCCGGRLGRDVRGSAGRRTRRAAAFQPLRALTLATSWSAELPWCAVAVEIAWRPAVEHSCRGSVGPALLRPAAPWSGTCATRSPSSGFVRAGICPARCRRPARKSSLAETYWSPRRSRTRPRCAASASRT